MDINFLLIDWQFFHSLYLYQEQLHLYFQNLESFSVEQMIIMIRSFFDKNNIVSETKLLSEKYFQNALDNLLVIPESKRSDLISFTNFIKNREY